MLLKDYKFINHKKFFFLFSITLLCATGAETEEIRERFLQEYRSSLCSTEEIKVLEDSGVLSLPNARSEVIVFDQAGRQIQCGASDITAGEVKAIRGYTSWSIQAALDISEHARPDDYLCEPVETTILERKFIILILPELMNLEEMTSCAQKIASSLATR